MRFPASRLRAAGAARPPVTADAGYGEITAFRLALEARGLPYVVAVKAATSAYPASAVPQTRPHRARPARPCPATASSPPACTPWRKHPAGKPAVGPLAP